MKDAILEGERNSRLAGPARLERPLDSADAVPPQRSLLASHWPVPQRCRTDTTSVSSGSAARGHHTEFSTRERTRCWIMPVPFLLSTDSGRYH